MLYLMKPCTVPVASGGDKVEERMHAVVSEAGVTLDAGLLSQNVIVLSLEVADNLGEAVGVHISADCTHVGGVRLALACREISGGRTWPRCQSGRRSPGCRQWSGRCACPPHQALALRDLVSMACLKWPVRGRGGLDAYRQ